MSVTKCSIHLYINCIYNILHNIRRHHNEDENNDNRGTFVSLKYVRIFFFCMRFLKSLQFPPLMLGEAHIYHANAEYFAYFFIFSPSERMNYSKKSSFAINKKN